jgi:hypothetical protein
VPPVAASSPPSRPAAVATFPMIRVCETDHGTVSAAAAAAAAATAAPALLISITAPVPGPVYPQRRSLDLDLSRPPPPPPFRLPLSRLSSRLLSLGPFRHCSPCHGNVMGCHSKKKRAFNMVLKTW